MYRRHILVTGLAITGALAGCAGDGDESGGTDQTTSAGGAGQAGGAGGTGQTGGAGGTGQTGGAGGTGQTGGAGGTELTGVETYSGEWEGSVGAESYNGVWEFEADFDDGEVVGLFRGEGAGDINGTISGGEIEAEGTAGFGAVEWSGEFESNGRVSGTWELVEAPSQGGTWEGSVGELPGEQTSAPEEPTDTPKETPQSDVQGSDIEDVPRYPGSVRTLYAVDPSTSPATTGIRYTTEATIEDVYAFYESELEDEGWNIRQRVTGEDGGFVATKGSKQVVIGWEPSSDYEGYLDIVIAYTAPA